MKTLIALMALIPTFALAESPFDGTWKGRLDSVQFEGKPDVMELKDGLFTCRSCVPTYTIKADGTDQAVPEHTTVDHQTLKIVNANTVERTFKKAGKVTLTNTLTASADGAKLSVKFTDYTSKSPVSGSFTERRVAPGAAGAHAVSGSWMSEAIPEVTEAALVVVFTSTPNGLQWSNFGRVYDAKFDGKEYPITGDTTQTTVTLRKISDHVIEESDHQEGKVYDIVTMTVAPDGKTITSVDVDPVHGTKTTMVYAKQP